jgi:hypothetical protein
MAYKRFEVSQSSSWTERFGSSWPRKLDVAAFPFVAAIDDPTLGLQGSLTWPDLDSEPVSIAAEAIKTGFGIALLIWVPQRQLLRRKRKLAVASP